MATLDIQKQQLARIAEKNSVFSNLLANDDFLKWKDEVLKVYLDNLSNDVLSTDRSDPLWKEILANRLVAYQEAMKTYETLFKIQAETGLRARTALKQFEVST